MKLLVLVLSGVVEEPVEELEGQTPLAVAETPHLDFLAQNSLVGQVQLVPPEGETGSDLTSLALLGYDPVRDYTGRGDFEVHGLGGRLDRREVAFRLELVGSDGERITEHYPDPPSPSESEELFALLSRCLNTSTRRLYPHRGPLGIAVEEGGAVTDTTPPHRAVGQRLEEVLPQGEGEESLRRLIYDSLEILQEHPLNRRRREEGRGTLDLLWPWGAGRPARLANFALRQGWVGAVVSAHPAVRGVAYHAGLALRRGFEVPAQEAAGWGLKVQAARELLDRCPFVLLHLHAADEASHAGKPERKVQILTAFDRHVVGPLRQAGVGRSEGLWLIVLDYGCSVATREHIGSPSPFLLYGPGHRQKGVDEFSEPALDTSSLRVESGAELLRLLKRYTLSL